MSPDQTRVGPHVIILFILVWGMAVGWVAHFVVAGDEKVNWGEALLVGWGGSFVGGFLGSLVIDGDLDVHASGIVGSVVGAIVLLLIVRVVRRRRRRSTR